MENKILNRQQMQTILDNAPQGVDKKALIDKFVSNGYTVEGVNDVKEPNFLDKVGSSISATGEKLSTEFNRPTATPQIGTKAIRMAGDVISGAGNVVGQAVGSALGTVDQATGGAGSNILNSLIETYSKNPALNPQLTGLQALAKGGMEAYSGWKQNNPEEARNLEAVVNIASVYPIGKGASMAVQGAEDLAKGGVALAKTGVEVAKEAPAMVAKASKSIQDIGKTPKTVEQAVGQIAQGTPEVIAPVKTALSVVDTSKVKTYSDLLGQINKTIPELATKVDNELAKDTTRYTLANLTLKKTTQSGRQVATDYVSKGLNELKDYYTAVGNDVAKADIEDLIAKANTEGLTRKEVNDIARLHGKELNAYNANGQLASGITKQAVENTRQGLKEIARQGLGGEEAKLADSQLSALYETQDLIEKNVNAVNKLQQKIQERGLIEKLGYNFAKYADILTGGSVRGIVGGILPRGAGYKTMNALDLEEALRGNLDIVEKALKSKTDKELIDNLNQLKSSVDESMRPTSSLNKNTQATTKNSATAKNITKSIPQTKKGASGKMGGFVGLVKETPAGKLKGKILPEDADSVIDFANVVNGESKVADDTYLAMRKEIKAIARQYGVKGTTDRELVDNLQKKIYNDYHKFPGFSELGLLPNLALGTAVATGALKAGVEYKKSKNK